MNFLFIGSMVEELKRKDCDHHGLGSKPTGNILLCSWYLRHFLLLGEFGKQFQITVTSL